MAGVFHAVGAARAFPSAGFWTDDSDGLLYLFHLHGFAELAAYAAGSRTPDGDGFWVSVVASWLDVCAQPLRPAWHPFPMSGRIIAWCATLSSDGWPPALARRMRNSLASQATVLRRSIEHDIGGNHVLRNAVALTFAGVCLEDAGLEGRALRLLEQELGTQLLADGGHEERSPSYHREVLSDLRDVRTLLGRAGREPQPWLESAIEHMNNWVAALAGPDRRVPLLNDAWEGPETAGVDDAVTDLYESGYLILRDPGTQAVLDIGPVSPPHLPPHAHADVLSFVLWADGAPVVVDPGVLSYSGPDRAEFRATRAHNTVEVDGVDQCEFWGDFRAAYLPRVRRLRLDHAEGLVVVSAEHDGYRRLADPVIHRRTFVWSPGAGLVVVDRLLAGAPHEAASFLHLAPDVTFADGLAGPLEVLPLGPAPDLTVADSRYAPFLGTAQATQTLVRRGRVEPGTPWGWALVSSGTGVSLRGDTLRIAGPGRAAAEVLVS